MSAGAARHTSPSTFPSSSSAKGGRDVHMDSSVVHQLQKGCSGVLLSSVQSRAHWAISEGLYTADSTILELLTQVRGLASGRRAGYASLLIRPNFTNPLRALEYP